MKIGKSRDWDLRDDPNTGLGFLPAEGEASYEIA